MRVTTIYTDALYVKSRSIKRFTCAGTFAPFDCFAVWKENINSESVVAFLDALVLKLFDVCQGVERTAEVCFPRLGIRFVCAGFVSP